MSGYSERLLQLFHSRAHGGRVPEATHVGVAGTPGKGPSITLTLRVEDGVIRQAGFLGWGCPVAIACGEAASLHLEGQPLTETKKITATRVAGWVDGVPDEKAHCPRLVAEACQATKAL